MRSDKAMQRLEVCWNDAWGTVYAVGAFPVCPLKPLNSALQSES